MANMRLSARADYALRAAIELAAAQDGHVTAEQLAQAQNIPGKFLETILTHLRRANIVLECLSVNGVFRPAAAWLCPSIAGCEPGVDRAAAAGGVP